MDFWRSDDPFRVGHAVERLRVADAMTTKPATISAGSTVSEAIERIRSLGLSTYPVVDDGNRFVGMISDARLRRLAAEGADSEKVRSHVDSRPHALPEHPMVRAMVRMDKTGVRQLAVIDRKDGNKLVGLLTMRDIVRAHVQVTVEAGDPDRTAIPEFAETVEPSHHDTNPRVESGSENDRPA